MVYKNKLCQIDIDLGAIYNHYQFSKEIATVIGYDINNSNEDSTFYVNGTDIRGKHGFLRYTVRDDFYIENIL
jgi:hypothetical protein